jgi:hypothetical protein
MNSRYKRKDSQSTLACHRSLAALGVCSAAVVAGMVDGWILTEGEAA